MMPREVVVEFMFDVSSVYSNAVSRWSLSQGCPVVRGTCAQRARLSRYSAS